MSFGKMTKHIQIVQTIIGKDAEGFKAETDKVILECKAYKEDKNSSEKWAGFASFATATTFFRVRFNPDVSVTTKHFIICDGLRYNILSVENVRERNMYLEIVSERVEPSKG